MVTLIIPFYNCEKTVENTVIEVKKYIELNRSMEFIAVDDGSTDGTLNTLKSLEDGFMRVVGYEKNKGKGGAIQAGVAAAKGDKIAFTDADLAYGLEPLERFVAALDIVDIAVGTRREDHGIAKRYGFLRTVASNAFSALCESMLHLGLSDTQCGFKAYRAEVAKELFAQLSVMDFGFDFEILAMARNKKYSIVSVPVTLLNNAASSNVRVFKDGFKLLCEICTIRKKSNSQTESKPSEKRLSLGG